MDFFKIKVRAVEREGRGRRGEVNRGREGGRETVTERQKKIFPSTDQVSRWPK